MSQSSYRVVACVLVSALFIAGCGKDPKGTSEKGGAAASAPSAMLDLIPKGTAGVVYIPSLKTLEDDVRRVVAASDEQSARTLKIADAVSMLPGVDPADLDMTQGAALALTTDAGGETGMTAVIPVRDEKAVAGKVKAQNPGASVEVKGGFAAVAVTGGYARGGMPASLAGPLPPGDVVIRLDMAALGKTLGPMAMAEAEEQLEAVSQASGDATRAVLKPMLGAFKSIVDESSVWTVALSIEGTMVEADMVIDFANGKRATLPAIFKNTDLAALARGVPDGAMFTMALSIAPEEFSGMVSGFLHAMLDVYPQAQREAMRNVFEASASILKAAGPGLVGGGSFSPGGMELMSVLESPDPAKYIQIAKDMVSSVDLKDTFMTMGPVEERTIDGTKVVSYRIKLDAEKLPQSDPATTKMIDAMYGKDGIHYHAADLGNRVLVVMGGDEALKRGLKTAKEGSGSALSKAIAAAGPDTVGYLSFDMRTLMRFAMQMVGAGGEEPGSKISVSPGEPVPLTMIANATPSRFRARLSLDWGKMMKVMKEIMPK